jgi:hypothetical protein
MPWRGLESSAKKGDTVKSLLRVVVAFIAICAFGTSGAVAQDTHSQGTASSPGAIGRPIVALPDSPAGLGAGGPEFKSRRPDHVMFFVSHHLA